MKIYISGKITGYEDVAKGQFASAAIMLEKDGHIAIDPFQNGLRTDDLWEKHLAVDLNLLMSCDLLVQLPGWEDSRGARLEYEFAKLRGIPCLCAEPDDAGKAVRMHQTLSIGITQIGLSVRTFNPLLAHGIYKLADAAFLAPDEIARIPGFGRTGQKAIRTLFDKLGLEPPVNCSAYGVPPSREVIKLRYDLT